MTPPKNREELIDALGETQAGRRTDPESIVEAIESLGLAIVPKEPTEEMIEDAQITIADYYMLIAASPFRQEDA